MAVPNFEEQKLIVAAHKKLENLSDAIDEFNKELALNPKNASLISERADSMLEEIGHLTDADKIMSLARQGESREIEFKESLSMDVATGTKEKYIEVAALKTIVAFLNTLGGYLLVGVDDSGGVKGVADEVKRCHKNNYDNFMLFLKNKIKQRIGEQYYPFIESKIVDVGGNKVLMVECQGSPSPCYLDEKDFYVRTNPATDKLEGPKLVEYVQNHFSL
ncbi:ATP-binding protein [Halospina sp. K52047b]|nr:ATP-binding protein [Halospina sp. K52047b]